jgi:hypothetical protein
MRTRKQTNRGSNATATLEPTERPANGKPELANGPANGKAEMKAPTTSKVPVWEFLADEERDRDGTGTWLYRLHPVIDRKPGEHAICRKRGRFTRDDILRDFGSGVYQIQVNNSQGKQLYAETISFHNPTLPPKVDPLEVVVGDPRNASYFEVWGKRSNVGDAKPERETITRENIAEIIRAAQEGNRLDPKMVEWLQSMANARDGLAEKLAQGAAKSPVDDLATLAKAFKEMMPSPAAAPAPPQPDLLSVIASVKSLQSDPLALMEKLKGFFPAGEPDRPKAEAAPTNSLDELKKLLQVFGEAKTLFTPEAAPAAAAVAASPDASPWEQVAVQLPGVIAPILNGISGIIMAAKAKPGDTPAMAGMPATPAPIAFNPYDANAMKEYLQAQKMAATRPQPAAPGPSPVASTPGTGAAPRAAEAQPESQPQDMMQQVLVVVAQALNCLNRDVDGHEAAASIISLNGTLAYETLVQQIQTAGIPVVIELAKNTELAPQVAAYEGPLGKFIEEFIEGPDWNDDQDAKAEQPLSAS